MKHLKEVRYGNDTFKQSRNQSKKKRLNVEPGKVISDLGFEVQNFEMLNHEEESTADVSWE